MSLPKLVRDHIPNIIKESGKTAVIHKAEKPEYYQALKEKLIEEANEFVYSDNPTELVDILEVIESLCRAKKITPEAMEKMRESKLQSHGGFNLQIILDEIKPS